MWKSRGILKNSTTVYIGVTVIKSKTFGLLMKNK